MNTKSNIEIVTDKILDKVKAKGITKITDISVMSLYPICKEVIDEVEKEGITIDPKILLNGDIIANVLKKFV